jgi:large subunit ribosomal protein L30
LSEQTETQTTQCKCIVAVKIRGSIDAGRDARATLQMLHLNRTNHAVIIDDRPAFTGMLRRVQNYVTWGEASKETVLLLLKERGKLVGGRKLTEENVHVLGFNSLEELAQAIVKGEVEYWKLDVQPVFKLHPPAKGYKGKTKRSFSSGGESGYRGDKINELVKRMS